MKLKSKMAKALPEILEQFTDFQQETPLNSYVSVDAVRDSAVRDSQSHVKGFSDPMTASRDADHEPCCRANGSVCQHDFYDGIIVHHEQDSKFAYKLKNQLNEKLGHGTGKDRRSVRVEQYGNVCSSPLFGALEKICQRTRNIIVLWTPAFQNDEKSQNIGQTIYALQSSGYEIDITVICHELRNIEKNEKRVVLCNNIYITYEDCEYFFATMKTRLLKYEALCKKM